MIQAISSTPVDTNFGNKSNNSKNCISDVNEQQGLVVEEQEQEDPEPGEEFKAELRNHFEQLKQRAEDYDREKRQSSGGRQQRPI